MSRQVVCQEKVKRIKAGVLDTIPDWCRLEKEEVKEGE
jgi:hypothetical protein